MKRISTRMAGAALTMATLLAAAPGGANATPIFTVSFDDVGIGNLSGYNPFNIIDGQTADVTVNLSQTQAGLVTSDVVSETLNGVPFTVTQHGSQVGTVPAYVAGFTFNLGTASYVQYVPSSPGQTWAWIKGTPVLEPLATSSGLINVDVPDFIGAIDTPYFADLPAGKYTLLFAGIVNLAVGESTSFGGTLSTVPLPGSLVMFGAALLGLTAFGARRRPNV